MGVGKGREGGWRGEADVHTPNRSRRTNQGPGRGVKFGRGVMEVSEVMNVAGCRGLGGDGSLA